MISVQQLMTGVVMGTILIVIGLVPGLLERWANALANLAEYLVYGIAVGSREPRRSAQQPWVAALGMALIALSLFLFTAR